MKDKEMNTSTCCCLLFPCLRTNAEEDRGRNAPDGIEYFVGYGWLGKTGSILIRSSLAPPPPSSSYSSSYSPLCDPLSSASLSETSPLLGKKLRKLSLDQYAKRLLASCPPPPESSLSRFFGDSGFSFPPPNGPTLGSALGMLEEEEDPSTRCGKRVLAKTSTLGVGLGSEGEEGGDGASGLAVVANRSREKENTEVSIFFNPDIFAQPDQNFDS